MMRMSFPGLITLLFAASLFAQQQGYDPSDMQRVVLVEAGQSTEMKDGAASPQDSWAVVVSRQLYVFKGGRASLRTKTRQPEFQFEMDPGFDAPVYLFRFDVRSGHDFDVRANHREIRVAKGTGGLTPMSIPKDHLIETTLQQIGDGQNPMKRYRLKPTAPLKPGEYCLSRNLATCYDFGVD
jgi:hypothetical protein